MKTHRLSSAGRLPCPVSLLHRLPLLAMMLCMTGAKAQTGLEHMLFAGTGSPEATMSMLLSHPYTIARCSVV